MRIAWLVVCVAACRPSADAPPAFAAGGCSAGATRSCYSGPEATRGIGACHAGTQTCQAGTWSACADEVLPAAETCGNAADENCDGLTSCGEAQHVVRLGIDRDEAIVDVAAAPEGVAFIGEYRKTLDLGTGMLPAPSDWRNVVVGKATAAGVPLWLRTFTGKDSVETGVVAVGPHGEVAMSGDIYGPADAMGTALASAGGADPLFALIEADGAPRWAIQGKGSENDWAAAVRFLGDGPVVAGSFRGHFTLAGETLEASDLDESYVMRLDAGGKALWTRIFGGKASQYPRALATAKDAVAVAGTFRGELAVGGTTLPGALDRDAGFIAALAADGTLRWAHAYPNVWVNAVEFSSDGGVVAVGNFNGAVDFGGTHLEAASTRAVFVLSLGASGEMRWVRRFGGSADQDCTGLALDSRGRLVLSGYYQDGIDFGGGPLPTGGVLVQNLFVAKLEPDGSHVWSRGVSFQRDQWVWGFARAWRRVAIGAGDRIALGGYALGALDFGGPTTDHGGADMLFATLAP